MNIPINKVDVFEKDGYETKQGKVVKCEDGFVFVKCKDKKMFKIPIKSIKVSLTTRANSLDHYLVK